MDAPLARALVIGSTAFLTLVDLFATQAILPALAAAYGVRPAAMGLAVNAATLGMMSHSVERQIGYSQDGELAFSPTACQRAHPRNQLHQGERFGQIVIRPGIQALHALGYLAPSREQQDRRGNVLLTPVSQDT